jgi:hypothetical protein
MISAATVLRRPEKIIDLINNKTLKVTLNASTWLKKADTILSHYVLKFFSSDFQLETVKISHGNIRNGRTENKRT